MTEKYIKIIRYLSYATLFLPFLYVPFTYFPWLYGKTVIFQLLVDIMLGLYLVVCWKEPDWRPKKFSLLDWAIVCFLLVLVVSTFTGVNIGNSFWGNQARANGVFTWLHFGAYYFLLRNIWREDKDWLTAAGVGMAAAFLAGLTVIYPKVLPESWLSTSGGGIIGNRSFASYYLFISAGIVLVFWSQIKTKWRWALMAVAGLLLLMMLAGFTRGSIIGLMAGLSATLIFSALRGNERKKRIIYGTILGAVVAVSALAVFFLQKTAVGNYFPSGKYLTTPANYFSGTGETRLVAWRIALRGLKDRPILGWGWGNFEVIFSKYFDSEILKHGFSETFWDKPHNWMLEVGDSAGAIGIAAYLSIFVSAFYYLFKKQNVPEGGSENLTKTILAGVLVGYFVQNLFLFETTNTLILFFFLLAFIGTLSVPSATLSVASAKQRLPKFLLAILLLTLFIVGYRFTLVPLRPSYFMRQAELSDSAEAWAKLVPEVFAPPMSYAAEDAAFLSEQFTKLDKAEVVGNTEAQKKAGEMITGILEKESAAHPENASYPIWAGQAYLVMAEKMDSKYYPDAERMIKKAHVISPGKQEYLFILTRLYLLTKDFDKAIATQKEAVALAPDIAVSHWFMGLTYVASGDPKAGIKEIEKANELRYTLNQDQHLYFLELLTADKNYPKAIEEYKKMLAANPGDSNLYVSLATVYSLAGDKKSALDIINKVGELWPMYQPQVEEFIQEQKLK